MIWPFRSRFPMADVGRALSGLQRCPTCGGRKFQEGPRGGLSLNIRCVACGGTYWMGPPIFDINGMAGRTEQSADLFFGAPKTIQALFEPILESAFHRLRREIWLTGTGRIDGDPGE